MIPIKYPSNITQFQQDYLRLFSSHPREDEINRALRKVMFNGSPLNFNTLLIASFEELIEISAVIKIQYPTPGVLWDTICYKDYKKKIANFFMAKDRLKISSCYYCNIDFINTYSYLESDYLDAFDFINRASEHDLRFLEGIGETTSSKLYNLCRTTKIDDFNQLEGHLHNWRKVKSSLEQFDLLLLHNHFTLDHFLPQKDYKFLSLSLFNFVPSCYTCNSKLKKKKDLNLYRGVHRVSPTSYKWSVSSDLEFLILYNNELADISDINSFTIEADIHSPFKDIYTEYLKVFRIIGRYRFHKNLLLDLIEKKLNYSEEKIEDISNELLVSKDQVRKDIFGKELFEDSDKVESLTKLKRDIARSIKIPFVK